MGFDEAAADAIGAAGKDRLRSDSRLLWRVISTRPNSLMPKNRAFGGIFFHALFEPFENAPLVFARAHIDEVANDEAADVADAELARDLFRRFEIDPDERFFDIAARCDSSSCARVDVDGVHRFCAIEKEIASRSEPDFASARRDRFPVSTLNRSNIGRFIAVEFDFERMFVGIFLIEMFAALISGVVVDEKPVDIFYRRRE